MLKKLFLFAALSWTGVILFFCLIKASSLPTISVPYLDKIVHAFFHFIFVLLWFLFLKKKLNSFNLYRSLTVSFFFSLFFGIGIELAQQFFTTTRKGDVSDVAANLSGALLAVTSIVLLNKFNGIVNKI